MKKKLAVKAGILLLHDPGIFMSEYPYYSIIRGAYVPYPAHPVKKTDLTEKFTCTNERYNDLGAMT